MVRGWEVKIQAISNTLCVDKTPDPDVIAYWAQINNFFLFSQAYLALKNAVDCNAPFIHTNYLLYSKKTIVK